MPVSTGQVYTHPALGDTEQVREEGRGHAHRGLPRPKGAAEKRAAAAAERWVQGPEKAGVPEDSWASGWSRITQQGHADHRSEGGGLGAVWAEQKLVRRLAGTRDRRQVQDDHGACGRNSQAKRGERMGRGVARPGGGGATCWPSFPRGG